MDQHPPQDVILLRHMQWKDFRLPMLSDVLAEGLRGAKRTDLFIVIDGVDEVDDVYVDALQVLQKSEIYQS